MSFDYVSTEFVDPQPYKLSAGGPDSVQINGPEDDALDVDWIGRPLPSFSQQQTVHNKASGGKGDSFGGNFLGRGDVQAAVILLVGVWMLHYWMS